MRLLAFSFVFLGITASADARQTVRDRVANGVSEEVVVVDYPDLSLAALTDAAGAVVHLAVRSGDSFLSTDGTGVLTDYRASVVAVIKSSSAPHVRVGDVITIRRVGGTLDLEGRRVFSNESGFAAFESGREYVVFLRTDAGQPFELVSGPGSAFHVDEGAVRPVIRSARGASPVPMPVFVHQLTAVSPRLGAAVR